MPEIDLLKSYETNLKVITSLKCSGTNQCIYISNVGIDSLQIITLENSEIIDIENISVGIYAPNGGLIISTGEQEILSCCGQSIKPFQFFDSVYTLGIHVNEKEEIFVGLSDSPLNNFDWTVKSEIRSLDKNGKYLLKYEGTKDGKNLFNMPARIKTQNDMILLVDIFDKSQKGQISMLSPSREIKWRYIGRDNFKPKDIEISPNQQIVVSDFLGHSIDILNVKGEFIGSIQLDLLKMKFPYSLSFGPDSTLWIGCSSSDDEVDEAKFHAVKFI